jgi:hypothetical protein
MHLALFDRQADPFEFSGDEVGDATLALGRNECGVAEDFEDLTGAKRLEFH